MPFGSSLPTIRCVPTHDRPDEPMSRGGRQGKDPSVVSSRLVTFVRFVRSSRDGARVGVAGGGQEVSHYSLERTTMPTRDDNGDDDDVVSASGGATRVPEIMRWMHVSVNQPVSQLVSKPDRYQSYRTHGSCRVCLVSPSRFSDSRPSVPAWRASSAMCGLRSQPCHPVPVVDNSSSAGSSDRTLLDIDMGNVTGDRSRVWKVLASDPC